MPRAHACTRLLPHLPLRPPLRARGFSLVTVLLLIAVLASLGVGAMNAGLLQERMAGHARDRQQAQKAAEAALITRREETAAMRSQANTARLMEQNPTLMRLREIEALEKVAEKGRLSVVVGEGGLAGRVVKLV